MRWLVVLALALGACDGDVEPQKDELKSTSFMGEEPPCPEGAIANGDAPPVGYRLWCALPSGTLHGYDLEFWTKTGERELRLEYVHGRRHGLYQAWFPNGVLRTEGQYRHDYQCGTTTTWDQEGNVERVDELDPCGPL